MSLETLEKKLKTILEEKLTPEEREELNTLLHDYIESVGNKLVAQQAEKLKEKPIYIN